MSLAQPVSKETQSCACGDHFVQVRVAFEFELKFLHVLQVRVAEFQSEAVRCTLSGSGFPGLARKHQLAGLTVGLDPTVSETTPVWGKAETGRLPKGTAKGGAGKYR